MRSKAPETHAVRYKTLPFSENCKDQIRVIFCDILQIHTASESGERSQSGAIVTFSFLPKSYTTILLLDWPLLSYTMREHNAHRSASYPSLSICNHATFSLLESMTGLAVAPRMHFSRLTNIKSDKHTVNPGSQLSGRAGTGYINQIDLVNHQYYLALLRLLRLYILFCVPSTSFSRHQ